MASTFQNSMRALAANRPPLMSHREGQAEIDRLVSMLGLPPEKAPYHLRELNERILVLKEELAARTPSTPQQAPAAVATPILDQYAKISDPKARVAFYRANAAAFDAQFEASQPKPAPQAPCPFAEQDAKNLATYNSIRHPQDKMAFYRANARSLDRAIENQN